MVSVFMDLSSQVDGFLLKVYGGMWIVSYVPIISVFVAACWMVVWYGPTFMCISIDILGTKLYAPMTSNEDW